MDGQGRAPIRTTTVRLESQRWELVQREAARAGVSVSEYIRAAAVLRAAAAAARGEDPVERLSKRSEPAASPLPSGEDAESNTEYGARLWSAFRTGRADELAELVPDDVDWQPLRAGGRMLRGTREMHEFWASQDVDLAVPKVFHGNGDDVLVKAELPLSDGRVESVWWLYRFEGRRLVQAVGLEDEAEARSYSG
jgi:hypothetical protein